MRFRVASEGRYGTPDSAFLTGYPSRSMLIGNMTVVVGIVDRSDALIASDGLVIDHGHRFRETQKKSARLNDELCVAASGDMYWMGLVFSRLMNKPEWREEGTIVDLWEQGNHVSPLSLREAAETVLGIVQEVHSAKVSVLLAGMLGGSPYLYGCGWDKKRGKPVVLEGNYGPISLGVERPTKIEEEYQRLVCGETKNGERNLIDAIRLVSSQLPNEVNEYVCTRRLSKQFGAEWWTPC